MGGAKGPDLGGRFIRPIPGVSEEVRRNVVRRVKNLVGLRVLEVNIAVDDVLVSEERPQPGRRREL